MARLSRFACAVALLSCATAQYTPSDFSIDANYTSFNFDPTIYSSTTNELIQSQYEARFPLANGYIGLALAPEGPFFSEDVNSTGSNNPIPENGWPLFDDRVTFASVNGFWDEQKNTTGTNFPELLLNGGESVISGIPHFGGLLLTVNGNTYQSGVDNSTVSNFRSSFSYVLPVFETDLVWTPKGSSAFNLSYKMFLSEPRLNVAAVALTIIPSATVNATITDLLDGRSALRTTPGNKSFETTENLIWTSVSPNGINNVTAFVYSTVDFSAPAFVNESSRVQATNSAYVSGNASTMAQQWNVTLYAGVPITIYKYVGIASTDGFADPAEVARNASLSAKAAGYSVLLQEHAAGWATKLNNTIDLFTGSGDSNSVDVQNIQIADIASQYFLLSNLPLSSSGPNIGDRSVSVGGLASDSYGGLIFWDADTFMQPGLLLSSPEYAQSITNYRYSTHTQAIENAKQNGYPDYASLYAWTSSRYGNCTGTGPCADYEYHINSDIVLGLKQTYITTGNVTWLRDLAWPIINTTANMYDHLAFWNSSLNSFTIRNMTDPDEYANFADNGAFTMAGAIVTFDWATQVAQILNETAPSSWLNKSKSMYIPYEPITGIIEEFSGMNGSVVVKQADVVLLNFPLEFRYNTSQALRDLDWYAVAQSSDGPAMTWAIYSIGSAELSPHGCSAWTYALNSFEPYTRTPWFQFSEQQIDNPLINGGTNPAYPFLTGAGGFRQVAPFAFAGYRFHLDAFYLDPYLPPHLTSLQHRDFHWQGATLQVSQNSSNTTVCRKATSNPVLVEYGGSVPVTIATRNPMSGNYTLAIGSCLTVPTVQYHEMRDIVGNALQCQTVVTSNVSWVAGQFPLAAIDGANSTKWQPSTPEPASITVTVDAPAPYSSAVLLWAAAPPTSFSIDVSNSSSGAFENIYSSSNITISNPFNVSTEFIIKPRESNFTIVTFGSATPTSRFVRLTIAGTQGVDNTTGATVAEFAMIQLNATALPLTPRSLDFFSNK
jgi:trehalose/maltose hydrolase-like predicted phosphorylase